MSGHHPHHRSATTLTVEMTQINELNSRLAAGDGRRTTATDLGLEGAATAAGLPGAAVLVELRWDGSPDFPYIHGHFLGGAVASTVTMHTRALRVLSHRFGAHHVWGQGSAPEPPTG